MPVAAGDLPLDTDLKGELTIRKGDILDTPRGGNKHSFNFIVNEGFDVFKAKIIRLATATGDIRIFFKRSKSAVQSKFIQLTQEVFEDSLQYRWSKISQAQVTRWKGDGKTPVEAMKFEVFIYVPKETRRNNGIRRATENRIRTAAAAIHQHEADNNEEQANNINNNLRTIGLELNGTMVGVRVDISTLRTALGLPQH